jgi:hypothetical protein
VIGKGVSKLVQECQTNKIGFILAQKESGSRRGT